MTIVPPASAGGTAFLFDERDRPGYVIPADAEKKNILFLIKQK